MQALNQKILEFTLFKMCNYLTTLLFTAYIKLKHPSLISLKIKRGHMKKKTF